ncbi:MAG: hypothetical protein ACI8Y7_000721 [Candidatus Woesearchaeota archaeon]|jgi:hypothetical protein
MNKLLVYLATSVSLLPTVLADDHSKAAIDWVSPSTYLLISLVILSIASILLLSKQVSSDKHKLFWFLLIAIPIVLSTVYLAGHTIHKNVISVTGGPIHWHADYQIWACEERLDLVDPSFPKNKIGTPLFHEHNDDRLHVEGTVKQFSDVDLGSYFEVIGGYIDDTQLRFVTNDETLEFVTGTTCPNGEVSELAVYANGKRITQPQNYMYAHEILVPPGDCIIIEFGADPADTTQRLCESWDVADWNYDNYVELRGYE